MEKREELLLMEYRTFLPLFFIFIYFLPSFKTQPDSTPLAHHRYASRRQNCCSVYVRTDQSVYSVY